MLEQTKKNGSVYETEAGEKMVKNRPADTSKWKFGPYLPVTLYRKNDNELWMKDEAHGGWFHYEGPEDAMKLTGRQQDYIPEGDGFFYRYGMAVSKEETTPYFVQDMLFKGSSLVPDIRTFVMPFSLRSLSYDRTFTYPPELKELLRDQPAAYADRYKRPIIRRNGRTYPVSLTEIKTRWENLPDTHYPVVLDLSGSPFAVLDLEPEHSPEEELMFDSVMGYYEEKTMRGGRHKLVYLKDSAFKFRYGKGLELINNGMATFYGIDGEWFTGNPVPMPTEGFRPVGGGKSPLPPMERTKEASELLKKLDALTGSRDELYRAIKETYILDTDNSHREFCTLLDIYYQIIKPVADEFEKESLPWLLSACGEEIIEPREKHKTMRQGLPYLTYLAARIVGQHKDGGGKIWRM